ncbi:hypothetical protein, partial [Escherichia coli]
MTARSSALPYWMGTPAALLTLAFVVLPLVVTLSLSFFPFVAGGGTGDQLTLTHYLDIATDDYFQSIFLRTFGLA